MDFHSRRVVILVLLVISIGLLIPGLLQPVITIRGVLKPEGVSFIAPQMLEKGLGDDTVAALKSMMNPGMVTLLEATGGNLKKMMIDKLAPQIIAALQKNVEDIEVYAQTRSIVSTVQHLYDVKSPMPATLILLFSVVVPFAKAAMILWALFLHDAARRRTLDFVELIAKWSMADVFVVALFIAYLAAQASQTPPGDPNYPPPMIAFTADFGAGFYWFTAYCIFSLASQQFTTRWFARADVAKN
ncbi:MAG: paraquat-inducible protein A [Chthoniobacteraceae bacterium]